MSVQHIGAHSDDTGLVNRETVLSDYTVRSVGDFFRDADVSRVGGIGGVEYVDGTHTFGGDVSSYGTGSMSNWYKGNTIQGLCRPYACDRCSYSATIRGNLRRHQLIHTEVRQFQCNVCAAKFRQKTPLVRHVKYKHQETEVHYQCAKLTPEGSLTAGDRR